MTGSTRPPRVSYALAASALPEPLAALRTLSGSRRAFLRLAAGPGFRGRRWSFLAVDPREELRAVRVSTHRTLAERLAALRPRAVERHGPALPFAGGWAGVIGYEARSAVEDRPRPRRSPLGFPALCLARYDAVLAWDHRAGRAYAAGVASTKRAAERKARTLVAAARRRSPAGSDGMPAAVGTQPRARLDAAAYRRAISAARRAVLRGDVFQANLSQRFDARLHGDALDLFERLAATMPAPYMTLCDLGDGRAVLSASPERFLRVRGTSVETDPMKGTRPRGRTRREDRALRSELERSEKDHAELAMIVDLSRNDLARTCAPGTVRVTVPRRLVSFPRVHQAIAVVRGRLAPGRDRIDALAAAFPPGSVTGAPKVRAMEVIDELEGEGRGPYCGALGWFDEGGDMDLAVAIRTILVSGRTASYRVGGAITLRSEPHAEWRETLDKGRGLYAALCGEEDGA